MKQITELTEKMIYNLAKTAKLSGRGKVKKAGLITMLNGMVDSVAEEIDDFYWNTTEDIGRFTFYSDYIKTATYDETKQLIRDIIVGFISGNVYGFIQVNEERKMLWDFGSREDYDGNLINQDFEYQEIHHYGGRFNVQTEINREHGMLDINITFETVWRFDVEDDYISFMEWARTNVDKVCEFVGDLATNLKEMRKDIKQLDKKSVRDYIKTFFITPDKHHRYNY